jgi:predicted PurR-regulated permease PerM
VDLRGHRLHLTGADVIERPAARDIPRITLSIIAILAMITATAWIMAPFIWATVWATMIVIATWPALLGVQRRLGGRRGPAVAVMMLLLLAVLVAPIWLGISTVAENVGAFMGTAKHVVEDGLPPPPAWVAKIPVVGEQASERWAQAAGDKSFIAVRILPYVGQAARWIADKAGNLGTAVVQLILTVIIAGVLYASGEAAALGVRRFLRRLAGQAGENTAQLAARAVRAVALGIVVTAVAQTALAGAGLFLGRVPQAPLLTAAVFVLCIAQVGPLLVMAPAAIWLFANGSAGRATVVVVFTLVAMTLDNFVRPILIRKGADLPLLLIMAGVFGGLLAVGILGLFVGPVVLAVSWTLVSSWVAELDRVPEAGPPGTGA